MVIAEDEAIVRLDLREILEEAGYEVAGEAGRGDEAVELVKAHRPDLVILDIKMPGMDGLEAASEITGIGSTAVLILTAFSQRDLDGLGRVSEHGVHHVGQHKADGARLAIDQRLGHVIGEVAEFVGGRPDLGPGLEGNARALTQGERADMLWHVPSAGCAPVGVAGMDLGAEAVDPVEALLGDVP